MYPKVGCFERTLKNSFSPFSLNALKTCSRSASVDQRSKSIFNGSGAPVTFTAVAVMFSTVPFVCAYICTIDAANIPATRKAKVGPRRRSLFDFIGPSSNGLRTNIREQYTKIQERTQR